MGLIPEQLREALKHKKPPEPRIEKGVCEVCGKEFEYEYYGSGPKKKYCSEKCDKEVRAKRNRERKCPHLERLPVGPSKENKLDAIMKEVEAQGITYSEYKKKRALEQAGKIQL